MMPMIGISLRSVFVVRSGDISAHESPRSTEPKTLLAATRILPGSCGENTIGVSQFQRNGAEFDAGAGNTLTKFGRMLRASPVTRLRRWMLPSCDSLNT